MTNALSTLPTVQNFTDVTFYVKNDMGMGISRIDAKTLMVEVGEYAQYERAITLTWKSKGQRRERQMTVSAYRPYFVLLNTADAIQQDDFMDASTRTVSPDGTVTTRGRYRSCDPRWVSDFTSKLEVAGITPLIMIDEMGKERKYHYAS